MGNIFHIIHRTMADSVREWFLEMIKSPLCQTAVTSGKVRKANIPDTFRNSTSSWNLSAEVSKPTACCWCLQCYRVNCHFDPQISLPKHDSPNIPYSRYLHIFWDRKLDYYFFLHGSSALLWLQYSKISTALCRVASLLKARVVLIKCYRGVSSIFV